MIEISVIVLSLIIEAYVILMIGVISWLYFASKKKKNDRKAALKLVDQIKHQSESRQASTGSYLKAKYKLEGPQLKKAINAIDRAEKRFFQKVIDLYLKRDAEALGVLDAEVAALIDTYKSLTPAVKSEKGESEKDQQIELLQAANAQLTEELAITNKTMSDMIAEFGNMFGGGRDNELDQTEVVEKVIAHQIHPENAEIDDFTAQDDDIGVSDLEVEELVSEEEEVASGEEENASGDDVASEEVASEEVASEEDIDDILNGIISPDK